ncbi:hypothetical protein D3C87_1225180 [compost metagenome]
MLHDADHQPADDVDQQDDDARDGVALDELAGAVHGAVEARLFLEVLAPALRLRLVDEAHVEVRIDAHLLARHAVEREARGDLGDALCAAGHDHVLHHDQDQEDDQADHIVAADHEGADGSDDAARIAVRQDQARGRHVQREAKERGDQQQRREGGELHRPCHVEGQQQHQEGEAEVGKDQEVEQAAGNGREQHHQHAQHQADQRDVAVLSENARQCVHRMPPAAAPAWRCSRMANTQTMMRATCA